MKVLPGPVAFNIQYIQVNLVLVTQAILVTGWEVTVDSPADIGAFGAYLDGFCYNQVTIGLDQDIGTVVQYAFISEQHPGTRQNLAGKQQEGE